MKREVKIDRRDMLLSVAAGLSLCGKGVRTLLCEAPFGPFRQKGPDPFFARPSIGEVILESSLSALSILDLRVASEYCKGEAQTRTKRQSTASLAYASGYDLSHPPRFLILTRH